MRTILFRAWDEPSQSFVEDAMPHKARHFEQPLTQFTGLKDMHGKNIYEGDIICWVDEVAVEEIEGHLRYEPEGKFVEVKIPDFYFFTADTVSAEECEIIGNIWENPDLLFTSQE